MSDPIYDDEGRDEMHCDGYNCCPYAPQVKTLEADRDALRAENERLRNFLEAAQDWLLNGRYATRVKNALAEIAEGLEGQER